MNTLLRVYRQMLRSLLASIRHIGCFIEREPARIRARQVLSTELDDPLQNSFWVNVVYDSP